MALDNLRGGTKRVVEENTPLNNLRGGTKRVVIVDGGGGSVDYAKTVQRAETMPTADASNAGQQFLYSGESDATYTHGYIYENVATTTSSSASAEQTVGSTLSDIAVDLDTLESFTGWTTDNSLQIFYTADGWSVDTTSLGVTYTGTPNIGDAITITYTAESTSYAWTQIDVQPAPEALPDQTGQSGKFLTTDGTDASWGNALVNNVNSEYALGLMKSATASSNGVAIGWLANASGGVSVGENSKSSSGVCIGSSAKANANYSIAVGQNARVGSTATGAIQFNTAGGTTYTNSDANTFKVANANGNYEIMSADGTIPTDRFTTTPSADGTYYPTLSISSGTATRSWGTINALQNTATGINGLTILGTSSSGTNSINVGAGSVVLTNNGVALGRESFVNGTFSLALGTGAKVGRTTLAKGQTIQLGEGENITEGSFQVKTYTLMSADGTVPADRLASTTGLADGNYRLRLTMSNGTPTLSWVAE